MSLRRSATLVLGAGALAVWLAAASGPGATPDASPTGAPPMRSRAEAIVPLARDLDLRVDRLRSRLQSAPAPRPPTRNPFQFALLSRPSVDVERRPPLETRPSTPVRPALALSGIAEDATPDGPRRTAIISGLGQLFLVQAGDEFGQRFRVVRVGAEGVELQDLLTGTTFVLGLR